MFWQMLWRCLSRNPAILWVAFASWGSFCVFIANSDLVELGFSIILALLMVRMTFNTVWGYVRMFESLQRRRGLTDRRDDFVWEKTGACFRAGRRAAIDHWKYLYVRK